MDIEKVWLRWTEDVENHRYLLINLYWFLKYRSLGLYAPRIIGRDIEHILNMSKDVARKQLEYEIALSNGNMVWEGTRDIAEDMIVNSESGDDIFAFFINNSCVEVIITCGIGCIYADWYYMHGHQISHCNNIILNAGIENEKLSKRLSLIGSDSRILTDGVDDVEVTRYITSDLIQDHRNYVVTRQTFKALYNRIDIDVSKCTFKNLRGIKCTAIRIFGTNKNLRYIRFTGRLAYVSIDKDINIEQCQDLNLTADNCRGIKRLTNCSIAVNDTLDLSNIDYINDLYVASSEAALDFGNKYVILTDNQAIHNHGDMLKIRYSNPKMTDALNDIRDHNFRKITLEYYGE